ncbi:MAG: hypothetical protein ABIW76_05515 [Fibrobacteria bacterium]
MRFQALVTLSALVMLGFASCTFDTAIVPADSVVATPDSLLNPPQPDPGVAHRLAYRVTGGSDGHTCRVEIRIEAWPAGLPKLFQAPRFYSDNPAMPVPGHTAASLTVLDSTGKPLNDALDNPLRARDTVIAGIKLDGNLIVVPEETRSLAYEVDLDPGDSSRFGLPIPKTSPGVDLIDGAYFFILPLVGRDFPAQWRTPVRLTLEFAEFPGRVLVGADSLMTYGSNYALMFVRGAFDPVRMKTYAIRGHEVTVYATSADTLDMDYVGGAMGRYIGLVEDSLMLLPTRNFSVGQNTKFWGIEGAQGYWFRPEAVASAEVHVHELCHTFVGIYQSDYDDPWWKEGMTDYLGLLLTVQAGLIGDTGFAANVLTLRDTLPAARRYSLSDPYVRNHLFSPLDTTFSDPYDDQGFLGLVYGKGSQAAMILDRYLLERSAGKKSVFDLIRELAKTNRPAFHRSELAAAVDRLAGGSSAGFLSSLLDRANPLGLDSLRHTYAALRKIGRFGPYGGKARIAGIDSAAADTASAFPGAPKASSRATSPFPANPSTSPVTRRLPMFPPPGSKI